MVLVALSLVVILGATALTMDVGMLAVAAQRAQAVADAAAFAAGTRLPNPELCRAEADRIVAANNASDGGTPVSCEAYALGGAPGQDVVFYGPWGDVPSFGSLGQAAWAVRVTCHVPVDFSFARVLGFLGAVPSRSCTVVRMPVGGVPIVPMWISAGTEYNYGQLQQLLMADGPHYENIPGSFGWLTPPNGDKKLFEELLRGYNLTPAQMEAAFVNAGDTVAANPGLRTGIWTGALESAKDGLARLQRAQWAPWTHDTFIDFQKDNPRILVVPMVEYVGGNGANAEFLIHRFGGFYLESVNVKGNSKEIWGRFVDYTAPGAAGDPFAPETGLWTNKVVE